MDQNPIANCKKKIEIFVRENNGGVDGIMTLFFFKDLILQCWLEDSLFTGLAAGNW